MIQMQMEMETALDRILKIEYHAESQIQKSLTISMDQALVYLNNNYPDLKFEGQFFPESKEFWIYANGIVLCKATGKRINIQKESQAGRSKQSGEYKFSANPNAQTLFSKSFNSEEIATKIGEDTFQNIIIGLNEILK